MKAFTCRWVAVIWLGALLLGFLPLTGCQTKGYSDQALAFVHVGQTTRADVTENFGPPQFQAKDRNAIGYLCETVAGTQSRTMLRHEQSLPVFTTETSALGRTKHALFFQFDDTGLVRRFEKTIIQPGQAADVALVEWSRKAVP